LSAVLHGGALTGLALWPELWWWFGSAVVINHVLLFIAVLYPRSAILGQNLTRLPSTAISRREIGLTFDDGPDPEITPRILDILDQYNAKASFFCVASRAAIYPEVVRDIIRRGHSVENHSLQHSNYFAFLGWRACKKEIHAAQQILSAITGTAPQFFRAPMGFRSPMLDAVLADQGIVYVSWTRRGFDTVSRNPNRILARLLKKLRSGDILLLHDGIHWPKNRSPDMTLQVLPELLQQLHREDYHVVSLPMAMSMLSDRVVEENTSTSITAEYGM